MKKDGAHLIKKTTKSHRVKPSTQTGFSSPATHYNEPRIDLNDVLVKNPSATFYVRVVDNSFLEFDIIEQDVLIIDKSVPSIDVPLISPIAVYNFFFIDIIFKKNLYIVTIIL